MNRTKWRKDVSLVLTFAALWMAAGILPLNAPAQTSAEEARQIQILESNASDMDKDAACRELQVIGTKACIPAVAALLANDSLSHMGRYVLEAMEYPEALEAMREAVEETAGMTRFGIITSLGYRRDPLAVPVLEKVLETETNQQVREGAISALGRIGTEEAARVLEPLAEAHPESLRPVLAEACLALAEQQLLHGDPTLAAAIYTSLQSPDWPEFARLGAFLGLLQAEPNEAGVRIMAAIGLLQAEPNQDGARIMVAINNDDDPLLRATAISGIVQINEPAVLNQVIAVLPQVPPAIQAELIQSLSDCRYAPAREAIEGLMASEDGAVRLAAIQALGRIGTAESVPLLTTAVIEPKSDAEAAAALISLEVLPADGVNGRLLAALASAPAETQRSLINVLVARRATDTVEGLLAQAPRQDGAARRATFNALGALATPEHLPAMLRLLVTLDGDTGRSEAERAIVQVARRVEDPTEQTRGVMRALRGATEAPTRHSLLRVMGGIGGPGAFRAVRQALEAEDEDTQDVAIRTLADWPDAIALDTLLEIYQTSDSTVRRVLALRGAARLLAQGARPEPETVRIYNRLMQSADRADDKRLLLSGLAGVSHPAALRVAAIGLEDADTRGEAEMAIIRIAQAAVGAAPSAVAAVAERLKGESQSEDIRNQANALLEQIAKFEDYLVSWQVSGPYMESGKSGPDLYDVAFAPEQAEAEAAWRTLAAGTNAQRPWMMNLSQESLAGDHRVAYARTTIASDAAGEALLEIGFDDGVKAWFNGEEVFGANSAGAAVPGEVKVPVTLRAGDNQLMLKVIQHTAAWEFCARLVEPSAPVPPPDDSDESLGWTPLFNGEDLTGWSEIGNAVYYVEDGLLIGTQTDGRGGDLFTDEEWEDFELVVEYRVVWPANTGFWFRSRPTGNDGYQYDVLKWANPVGYSGTLYCPGKMFITTNLDESIENRDGWNVAHIRAQGKSLTLWLNGQVVGQTEDDTHSKGKFGIQVHGGDEFRNMKIFVRRFDVRPL